MDAANAIVVEKLCKDYRLKATATRSVKSAVLDALRGRRRASVLHALKDLSFSVAKGETLGIIGHNGAGKSTLLALITGTLAPTSGRIDTRGTISSLLELGAGFHPDLTGRENVYLYGATLGLSRRQMRERFDGIVEFAGLSEFIDQPVKHYSSGMYIRLGFAVAVEVDPDILLIDEVLAVGDVNFQRKCLQKMDEFRGRRKTMLVISHDLGTIQRISDRILLLDQGRIMGIGEPSRVVGEYQALSRRSAARGLQREWGTGEVRITGVSFSDGQGRATEHFRWGDALEARIAYEAARRVPNPVFGFAINDAAGRLVFGSNTQIEQVDIPHVEGKGVLSLRIERLSMAAGSYLFSFSVHSADHLANYHRLDNHFPISIECDRTFEGVYMPMRWEVQKP